MAQQRTLLESRDEIRFGQEIQQAFGITIVGRVVTPGAVPATLLALPLSPQAITSMRVKVTARRVGGSSGAAEDGAGYELYGVYNVIAGVATPVGVTPVQVFGAESQAGWNATLTVSGGNVLVQVTGAADNTVVWVGRVHLDTVST